MWIGLSNECRDPRQSMSRLVTRAIRSVRALALAAAGLACVAAPAAAQNPAACRGYKAELANLSNNASTARALQSEIGRLEAYYRTLNCEGGKFLFFDTRPPQCGAVEQRIRALNAGYGSESSEVTSARKRQLQAAIATACAGVVEEPSRERDGYASGGAQVICVRTCDGAFFPMRNLPEGRGGADEMCQALCPGTEAVAYSMPYGDDALKRAGTVKGNRAYTSLANAFKFQKTFVPNCSCKKDGQSWAQSLVKAESMLVKHKGDIFVTPMQAEALSRPKVRLTLVGRADKTAAAIAADAAGRHGEAAAATDPTTAAQAASANAATGSTGRAAVRIIAPDVVAAPARAPKP